MKIEKKELMIICNRIIDFLPERVEISEDNYWLIDSDSWTTFSEDPSPSVGSLNDDWHFLQQIIEDNAVSCSDLDRLSSILRAISQEINPI